MSPAPPQLPRFFKRVLDHQSSLALVETRSSIAASTGDRHVERKYAQLLARALELRDELLEELAYILTNSEAAMLVASESFRKSHLGEFLLTQLLSSSVSIPVHIHTAEATASTSAGTESKTELSAKANEIRQYMEGVVTTHSNLTAQIHDIVSVYKKRRNIARLIYHIHNGSSS